MYGDEPLPEYDEQFDGPDAVLLDAVTGEYEMARRLLMLATSLPHSQRWDFEVRYQRALSALVAQRDRDRLRGLLRHQGAA